MIKSLETSVSPIAQLVELEADEVIAIDPNELPVAPLSAAAGNFHINLMFNASTANAPSGFANTMQTAARQIEALFSDSITLNITVGWGEIGGDPITRSHVALGGASTGHFYTYAQTVAALTSDRTTPDDFTAVAAMGGGVNPNQNGSIAIWRAQERALGLVAASDGVVDGRIGFSTDFPSSYWLGGAIHEITHAMGRTSGYSVYGVLDMMRYTGAGQHVYAGGTPAYFSIDNGATRIANYDTTSDFGDFVTDSYTPTDPLNAYISGNAITSIDARIMDVIGFNRVVTQAGSISISDVSVSEGNSGTSSANFTVSRTGGSGAFTVNYATAGGTASAGVDFGSVSGTLSFGSGVDTLTISVPIYGDTAVEADETFTLTLSSPSDGATLTRGQAVGTIVNDDSAASSVTVSDISVFEGNSGTSVATFTVSRSGGSGAFTVDYATANGTALAGSDYASASGTLSFAAGVNTQTVAVTISGDTAAEADETFTLNLTGATNGTSITRNQAVGTILNDDAGDDFRGDASTTGQVAVNGTATGTLEAVGDHDWFRVQLAAGTAYTIRLDGVGHNGGTLSDPLAGLYSGSSLIASDDDGGGGLDSQITFTPTATGTYFIDAGAFANFYAGRYTVSVSTSGIADDFSANAGTTGRLPVGGTASGSIEVSGDRDWFKVQLSAGLEYTIDLLGASAGVGTLYDPYERIYNSAGTVVASNDDGAGYLNSRVVFTPTATSLYYVEASGFADAGAGTYRLAASAPTGTDVAYTDTTTNSAGLARSAAYTGPVSYLQHEYIWSSPDAVAVVAGVPNTFLKGGAAGDALTVSGGQNVLDGGGGSNFLTGGTGADGGIDTFFVDSRGGITTWSTIVNFHKGDYATIWGFRAGISTMPFSIDGAPGYTGTTIHSEINGAGTGFRGSMTFAGIDRATAAAHFEYAMGSQGVNSDYLLIHYA